MELQRLGKYEILAELGQGGFGTVYEARDTLLERAVALKVLHPTLMDDPSFVARFRREAQAAARLEHPHIITIYEVGEVQGRHFIAMRLLKGASLSSILKDATGPLPLDRVLLVLSHIAGALDYAHSQGVIHRDVKPSNIFVTADGAILTDFGIVRVLNNTIRMTTTGQTLGTPEYMAPEQILGEEVSPQTDIYALGVAAFQMFTGKAPFTGSTPFAVQDGHVRGELPSARQFNPALPPAVDAILAKALAKAPAERYASATQFVADLQRALLPQPQPVAPPTVTPAQLLQPAIGASSTPRMGTPPPSVPVTAAPGLPPAPPAAMYPPPPPKPKRRIPRWVWIVVPLILLVLCSCMGLSRCLGGQSSSRLTPTPKTINLEIFNQSTTEICHVYISPSATSNNRGNDWMGESRRIKPGGDSLVFLVAPGKYDLLAQDCQGKNLAQQDEVELYSDSAWRVKD